MINSINKIGLGLVVIGLILTLLSYFVLLFDLWVRRFTFYLLKKVNCESNLYKILGKCTFRKYKNYNIIIMKIDNLSSYLISIGSIILGISLSYLTIKIIITLILYPFRLNNNLVEYLTLTLALTLLSYFPDKFTFWFYNILNKLFGKLRHKDITMTYEQSFEKPDKLILILQPKLWMYLISIVFTLLNSFEKISGTILIEYQPWIKIKPIIFESVFTMLIIDRFVKQVKSDKDKISNHIKDYKNKF